MQTKQDEGWTGKEKFDKQKQSTKSAVIMAIASIGVIIIPYFFIISYSWIMTLLLTISGLASLLTAALIFLWFNKTRQYEEDSVGQFEIDQQLSVGVYTFSFLVAMYNIFIAFYLMFHVEISAEFYQAENGQINELLVDYSYLTYIILPLLFIITLCLAFSAFVSYIAITEKDRLRICVLVFALSTTILAFLCYYYSRQAKELAGEHIWFDLFHLLVIFVIVLAILSFMFAFLHRSNTFTQFGYALLIILFLLAGTSFLYFREMQTLRESNKQNCRQFMRNTHQDFILNQTSCNKYTREITCTSENSALLWEKDNTQVCLNQNCCNAVAELYLEYHIKSSFGILLLIISCFALVNTLLEEAKHDAVFSNKGLEYALALSMIGFIIFGVIILLQGQASIPQQDMVIVSRQINVKQNHHPVVFPQGIEGVTYCEAFSVIAKRVLNREFKLDTNSRVSILAPKNQIIVTHYYNSPNISYLPVLNGKQLLYPSSRPEDGFLGVQGSYDEVTKFFMEKVEICGVDKSQIQIDIYALPAAGGARMLFHRHDTPAVNSFTSEQINYINSLHYTNVKAKVIDITNLKPVQNTTLYLFHKEEDCGKFGALPYQIIKLQEDETLLYNLIQKEYFYGAEKQGYYQFCNKVTIDDKHNIFEVSLVPRNTKKGQFTVVMETPQQNKFDMVLGVTTTECKVGYFNEECGSIRFYGTKQAQAISIDKLAERQYTFFVYFDYKDKDLKELNRQRSNGVPMETLGINNDDLFDKYNPVVTLYAEETQRPIIRYHLPNEMKTQVHSEPNLTWLVLCVDGSVGDITQKSPNTFWTYASHPTAYQREESSKDIYPQVCGN